MSGLLRALYLSTLACVAISSVLAFLGRTNDRRERVGFHLGVAGLVFSTAFIVPRWMESGHPPLFGTFEIALLAAWSMLMFSVAFRWSEGELRYVWRFCAPWALILLGWGARYPSRPVPLTISEQSLWVDVHVVFAWLGFVPLLVLASMSLSSLRPRRHQALPAERHALYQRLLTWGFFAMTGMLVTGAWYSNVLFGAFWRWGIVETTSLIAWVVYGIILHRMLWHRWRETQLAWVLALTIPLLLIVFFVWSVFPGTFHFFDVPLVKPY